MSYLQEIDIFNTKLQAYIDTLDVKKRNKYTIKNDMYSDILSVLKEENTNLSSKFKFWTRETFALVHIGSTDLIYAKKTNLPLITHENIYYRIADCHVSVGHSGRDKTWAEVNNFVWAFCNIILYRLNVNMLAFLNRLFQFILICVMHVKHVVHLPK
jgi:hypothetical protein